VAEQALTSARDLGDRSLISRALAMRVLAEPQHPEAPQRTREAIRPLLRDGDVADAVSALIDVGYIALADGRLTEARDLLEQAHALAASQTTRFFTYANLGLVYLLQGEHDAAARALRDSLGLALETGIDGIDEVLFALAAHAVISGELERAARLAGAGHGHEPATLRHYELRVTEFLAAEYLAPGRERLGAARWDELAAEGALLGSEEAIELGR
jgi:tetratricopeptide (TPR) repeat protein